MANIDDLSISVKSNVTSATNSIDKLITKLGALSASLGQVNTSSFSAMASGIRQISSASNSINASSAKNITDLSLAIRKFGSGTATQASANIPKLSNYIQELASSVNGIGKLNQDSASSLTNITTALNKLGGAKVTQAVSNVPELTRSLQAMVGSVNQIGTAGNSVATLGQLASALSKLGGSTVTNAITNIPNLTSALMKMMDALSKAPQVSYNVIQLVNSLANLSSQGSKVGTASNSIYNGFMRFGKGADYARKKSFSLASAIGKLYAQYWLLLRAFRGIGKGITLASDLTEVQNVVDVAFGEYRSKIEDFADVSIKDYGMSELTAKQIASRYQAMGGAIGFAQGEMADMSIELTKLTADMASFYNVSQEAVAEDLQAIFTGQTRPLREYGLDLTQATLQEWALAQGMKVNIATMTQAEKVLLRYKYVMAQTAMAQGDFQRTQNTWANQIRILKQQFEALGAVIGQNFVYAIKPIVQALNVVMAKLIQFANVVSASLGKIFGWKFEDTTGGIVNDLEFGADAAEDLGGGLGGAADKAKKLKQQLQGFDELNVLTTNQASSGGGGGGGGFDNEITSTNAGQWVKDTEESLFESDLDSLYKLGDYIGTTLTNQLRSIDWQEVYQGAKDFGTGLASFLNGLISPELFSATGSTIAGALNTAIYSTLAFGEEFDFEELGLSIAEGINSFFRDTDFKALANDIDVWVDGIWQTILTAVEEISWSDIFKAIYDFFTSLDADTIAKLAGLKILAGLFSKSFFASITSKFTAQALFTAITSGISGTSASTVLPEGLKAKIGTLATAIFNNFNVLLAAAFGGWTLGNWLYENTDIGKFVDSGVELILPDTTPMSDYQAVLDQSIRKYGLDNGKLYAEAWQEGINQGMASHEAHTYANKKIFPTDYTQYLNTQEANSVRENILDAYGISLDNTTESTNNLIASTINLGKVLATTNKKEKNIDKTTSKYDKSLTSIAESSAMFGLSLVNSTNDISKSYSNINNDIVLSSQNTTDNISNQYSKLASATGYHSHSMYQNIVGNVTLTNMESTKQFSLLASNAVSSMLQLNTNGTKNVNNLKDNTVNSFEFMKQQIINSSTLAYNGMSNSFGNASNSISIASSELSKNLIMQFESTKEGANTSFTGILDVVSKNISKSRKKVTDENWYGAGTNLVAGLRNGLVAKWSSESGDGLVGKIVSLARGLTAALKRAFGIHSPSRLWRDDIGYYLAEGLRIGIVDEESNLIGSVVGMGERLTNSLNDSLTIATPSLLNGNYDLGVTSTMAHSYSADNSMSSSVADGVRQGLSASQMEQNALLREQNELLYQILQKESISSDDVYNVVVNKNRDTFNRTGTNPLFA